MPGAFYEELIAALRRAPLSKHEVMRVKRELCRKHHVPQVPSDIQVLLHASKEDLDGLKHLQTKPVRSISGVAPIAVMAKPLPCPHGRCTFCPGGPGSVYGDVPQSYTGKEPSTMRAIRAAYDPYLITFNRLEQYIVTGHVPDKVELIIQGGTFCAFPKEYQEEVVGHCLKAMNDFSERFFAGGDGASSLDFDGFKSFFELPGEVGDVERTRRVQERLLLMKGSLSLEREQERNETAKIRCVGMTVETKPDWGLLEHGEEMLRLGVTRVELGVESVYDDILHYTHRGHTLAQTKESIGILRDLGLKLNFHYMPGLPEKDAPRIARERDIQGMLALFDDPAYRPDMLKVYPCMVMPGTPLERLYKEGKYVPLTTEEAADLIAEFKRHVPRYCRIMRVQRDIPTYRTTAGVDKTNLRQTVESACEERGIRCACIRCREIRHAAIAAPEIRVMEYEASGGREFFISLDDAETDALIGFCRLRFPSRSLRKEIAPDSAIVRELHVFGTATALGDEGLVQHRGHGRRLLAEAEAIARRHGKRKILVISGIGAREYYKKLGYSREGAYMARPL
jgi:elongator complex protein 3